MANVRDLRPRQTTPSALPIDLSPDALREIALMLNGLVADAFALYVKTKNFHWHVTGPHFRDYHLLLDEQAEQIFESIDPIAERVRKLGAMTLRSAGQIAQMTRIKGNEADYVDPLAMLEELRNDNKAMADRMREAHDTCDEHRDVATASLLENLIDETERRMWFLYEASRSADTTGH